MKIIHKNKNLGFMQGRLLPIIDNMIQKFPVKDWEKEILLAEKNGWFLMEWTIDYFSFNQNPIINENFDLSKLKNIKVNSITADFFMQDPFFIVKDINKKTKLLNDFDIVIKSMINNKIQNIVLPLVDNASLIKNDIEDQLVIDDLSIIFEKYKEDNINFIFESDFDAKRLLRFIENFKSNKVGINYDTGNSASLGFDCELEIMTYGNFIKNCHLKDRVKGGSTVRFGDGNTNFIKVLKNLKKIKYNNDFIIQGARSDSNQDIETINYYRDYILKLDEL